MPVRIAKQCSKRWVDLAPAVGGRHCEACRLTVVDGERLTSDEFDRLLETPGARVCAYLVYLPDGSLLTRDHPRSVPRQAALAAGLAAVLACAGIACSPSEESRPASPTVESKGADAPPLDPLAEEMRGRLGTLGYLVAEPD